MTDSLSARMINLLVAVPYIVWLLISAIFFAIGEFFSKKFGLSPSWIYFVCVMGSYLIGAVLWLPAIVQNNQLSIVGAMWSVLSLLTTVLIGVLIFGEQLSLLALIGILLGVASVFILSIA